MKINNECCEYMYVVLVRALTGLGKVGRKLCGYEYTHIAVSFDKGLEDFVTFSRRKHYSPFNAGFMHEKREHYAFGNNKKVKVKIFKIPVSGENMRKIKAYVQRIEQDEEYIFNLYSMLTMPILHGIRIYKAHNCMSFVSKVIELSCSVDMEKPYHRYNIAQIDALLSKYTYKECFLRRKCEDSLYMKREGVLSGIGYFVRLNARLIYRLIFIRSSCGDDEF